jgi:hypothetical protein
MNDDDYEDFKVLGKLLKTLLKVFIKRKKPKLKHLTLVVTKLS